MISFEEFKRRKAELKYGGTEEELKKEYEVYVDACRLSAQPTGQRISRAPENSADRVLELQNTNQAIEPPGLSIFFHILAFLSLIGGVVLAIVFWPGDPGYGNEWKTVAYTWSILWASASIVETAIFAAIGSTLSYLNTIAINTSK